MSRDFLRNDARYRAIFSYLVRKHNLANSTAQLEAIRKLADQAAAGAQETITLTMSSSEGGSQSGEITCEAALLLLICERILLKYDPDQAALRRAPVVADFSRRFADI